MPKNTKLVKNTFGGRLHLALGGDSIHQVIQYLRERGLDIDYATLRRYINDERKPNFDVLVKLARACNKTVDWLITGEENNQFDSQLPYFNLQTQKQNSVIEKLAEVTKHHPIEVFQKLFDEVTQQYYTPFEIQKHRLSNTKNQSVVELPIYGRILNDNCLDYFDENSPLRLETATIPERIFSFLRSIKLQDLHFNSNAYVVEANDLADVGIIPGSIIVCYPLVKNFYTRKLQNIPTMIISENQQYFEFGYTCSHPFERKTALFRRKLDSLEFMSAEQLASYSFNQIFGVVIE